MRFFRHLLPFLIAATPAVAQQTQPVYTRPSKGSAVTVMDTATPVDAQVVTSAVYDMTAFSEGQFSATITQGATSTVEMFEVSGLGRFIKIRATYEVGTNKNSVTYEVLGADSATGNFAVLRSPGSLQPLSPDPAVAITNAKLVMTPVPYTTTQYTRPSKGENLVLTNTTLSSFTPTLESSPVIDMRGFAAVSISIVFGGPLCAYGANIFVYGSSLPTESSMRVLPTANSVRTSIQTASYAVNVASDYMVVGGSVFATGIGGAADCIVTITLTPLPYPISEQSFPRTARFATFYTLDALGTDVEIATNERYQIIRLQNLGAGVADCGPSGTTKVLRMAPETAPGNGGVLLLENFAGKFYCESSGGVATQIGFLNY